MRIVVGTNLLVSGVISTGLPRELLPLASYQGIPIVSAKDALQRITGEP